MDDFIIPYLDHKYQTEEIYIMKSDDIIRFFKDNKHELEKYGVNKIGLFRPYAKNQEDEDSDIDVLVEFSGVKSLFEMVGIELELADILEKKVDLVTEGALSPYIKDNVMKDLVVIYDEKKRGDLF